MKMVNILPALAVLAIMGCTPSHSSTGDWPDDPGTPTPVQTDTTSQADTTVTPDVPDTPDTPDTTKTDSSKPRYVWIDAAANFKEFADSKDNIARDLKKAADAGFTDIIVDVRPTFGDVLFKTSVVDQATSMYAWVNGVYSKIDRTADWDYLQAFIDEGHKLGLRVNASMNTMVGGRLVKGHQLGLFYRDSKKAAEWGCQISTTSGIKSTMNVSTSSGVKFMNPANSEVVDFICSLLTDLAKYDIDGIILDRARYDGLDSDFSDVSREAFEKYIGQKVTNFPGDILEAGATSLPGKYPTYLTKWLEFRVKTIYDLMVKARAAVKAVNPDCKFGVYVGGWYSTYYEVGVNWADNTYDPHNSYKWATSDYRNYGYANLMDHMMIGAYANPASVYGSTEWTVEGFCKLAKAKAGNGCPLICGGPDIANWDPKSMSKDEEHKAISDCVDAAMGACDGFFLFDMCQLRSDDSWQYVKDGVDNYLDTLK